jgi:hypothetical protein
LSRKKKGKRRQLGGREVEKFDSPGSFEEVQDGQGDGQGEASGAGAAGVDIQDTIMPVEFGFVSVAADDDVEAGSFGVEVELFKIVKDVDRDILELDYSGKRNGRCPGFGVHVAANGEDGCDGFELAQDLGVADVTCVNDGLGVFECREGFRAEESVSVGDDAEEKGFHLPRS